MQEQLGRDGLDVDPHDGRNETRTQRMDRNWIEILQELRVVQTGTQILTGFLLAVAFQPRFAGLDTFQHSVYLTLISTAALTTAAGIAPVTLHRVLFRRGAKEVLVTAANVILLAVLCGVGLMLTGVMLLIFDVTLGRTAGLVAGGVTVLVMLVIATVPVFVRRRLARRPGPGTALGSTQTERSRRAET